MDTQSTWPRIADNNRVIGNSMIVFGTKIAGQALQGRKVEIWLKIISQICCILPSTERVTAFFLKMIGQVLQGWDQKQERPEHRVANNAASSKDIL